MSAPPPPSRCSPSIFQPAATRTVTVFGAPAELVWMPERGTRQGMPRPDRPAFQPGRAERILREETVWQDEQFAVTPNRYPFARELAMLWPKLPGREAGEAMLRAVFGWQAAHGGTAMLNGVGAAASIACAHAHLTPEVLPFLGALRERPLTADWLPPAPGITFVHKDVPWCLVGVRGPAAPRATAVHALQLLRMTAAANLVTVHDTTWIFPRRAEVPAPHFPYALGGAEVWGRWCYVEEAAFAAANGPALEQALLAAGMPALS